jgi:hypothetical protein
VGAQAIVQGLLPIAKRVAGGVQAARDYSTDLIGDGATTALFAAGQIGLEGWATATGIRVGAAVLVDSSTVAGRLASQGIDNLLTPRKLNSQFGGVLFGDIPPLPGELNFIGPMKPSNWDALTAHPDGHAFSVHGGSVTDAQNVIRARTGTKPDGSIGPIPKLSSAFHSDGLLLYADQTIRDGGGLMNAISRQPGQSIVRVETQDVGNLGLNLGYGYARLGASGNKAENAIGIGPLRRIDGLSSAQGIYEYNPATGVWETITIYPAPY